jgi:hypothetical protein
MFGRGSPGVRSRLPCGRNGEPSVREGGSARQVLEALAEGAAIVPPVCPEQRLSSYDASYLDLAVRTGLPKSADSVPTSPDSACAAET